MDESQNNYLVGKFNFKGAFSKIILASMIILIFGLSVATSDQFLIFLPTLVSSFIGSMFLLILVARFKKTFISEIGFIYICFLLIYSILPGLVLLVSDGSSTNWVSGKLGALLPSQSLLAIHLWRHTLYIFGFCLGYLLLRGDKEIVNLSVVTNRHDFAIRVLLGLSLFTIAYLYFASASVTTYIDTYVRYDHLSYVPRKIASILIRAKLGIYICLFTLLFMQYQKYKKLIYLLLLLFMVYEILFSLGARIFSFLLLLLAMFLYNLMVKPIRIKRILVSALILSSIYGSIEAIRIRNDSVKITDQMLTAPGEIAAVYFSGFQLYQERSQGTLPPRDWQMFFWDLIYPFVFSSYTDWSPFYWYAKNYYPDAIVPPETLGPIAESALWGGEMDLFFRALLNGVLFAYFARWFMKRSDKWWAASIYSLCYIISILTIKYSVLHVLTYLIKSLIPVTILTVLILSMDTSKNNKVITSY